MPSLRIIFLLLVLSLLATGCQSGGTGAGVGQTAPDFVLHNTLGKEVRLSHYFGKPVMLNFFATWCGPCRSEMPAVQSVYERYKKEGLILLAVDVEEGRKEAKAFAREMGLTFAILPDLDGSVSNLYKVRAIPRTFFIGPDGVIHSMYAGSMTEKELIQELEVLIKLPRTPKPTPNPQK